MLNKSTSKKRNIWKLSIILPLLAVFLWSFNVKEVVEYREVNTVASDSVQKTSFSPSEGDTKIPSEEFNTSKNERSALQKTQKETAVNSENASSKKESLDAKTNLSEVNNQKDPFARNAKDILVKITKDTSEEELNAIQKQLEAEGFTFKYSNLQYNDDNEIIGISISYASREGNSGNYSVSSDGPINTIIIKSGVNGISMSSGGGRGNSAYINQGNGNISAEFEEQREQMRLQREEMRAQQEQMREEMQENRKEIKSVEKEEMKMRRKEMDERRRLMLHRDSLNSLHYRRVDSTQNFGVERERINGDSIHYVYRTKARKMEKSRGMENRLRGESMMIKDKKKITKNATDADLERIKSEYEAKGVSFSYRGLKRNSKGEITKIRIITNNGKGSKTSVSSQGDDDEPISDILIEF